MSDAIPWRVRSTSELCTTRIFSVMTHTSASPRTGREHEFHVLRCPDWVNVVPLTDSGEVVLVRQYRHGRREVTLEIPGGMVDPEDSGPAQAARRELEEETGWRAGEVVPIGTIAPNPAIQSNLCHSFKATGLRHVGRQRLDGTEEIEVTTAPLERVPALICEGKIVHSLVVVAFCFMLGLRPPPC